MCTLKIYLQIVWGLDIVGLGGKQRQCGSGHTPQLALDMNPGGQCEASKTLTVSISTVTVSQNQ